MRTTHTTFDSPVGPLLLVGRRSEEAPGGLVLTSLTMPGQRGAPAVRPEDAEPEAFGEVERQLGEYFEGSRTRFDLLLGGGGTEFQRRVWAALDELPYGGTTTYGRLAERLGVPPEEVRAVGAAIGANPVLVVRPCHRVIGADGGLRGYAGGLERKRRLLVHEGALQPTLI
ncbi:methylated-DNA--[protein]-cysteine S-methyltransferase [Phaeacidiphilus oryzae]|uniref:methylated-DNA--[protein]-cysteine S-methyltransferase n=1 Tax=Phaeacidiphilus oryzae TaxID=348818 RepID=UPI0005671A82|nr:methylated-DNA--[protein]-cysteine S-methyltransferase [Phaeacidiphilus oryzae]